MKNKKLYISLINMILSFLILCSCTATTNSQEKNSADLKNGLYNLSNLSEYITGTGLITKEGATFNNTMRSPKIVVQPKESHSIYKKGILKFLIKNTSRIEELNFQFITEEDSNWTNFKSASLPIKKTEDFTEYVLDISAQYGWLGNLKAFSLSSKSIDEGSIVIKSVSIESGGSGYYENIDIGPEEIISTFRERASKGFGMGPDGIMGQWRNEDGSINFIAPFDGKVQVIKGSETDPFQEVRYKNIVQNVDWTEFGYASIAQVIKDPNSDLLVGICHLERHYLGNKYYTATLALGISKDKGETWEKLDECITQNLPVGEKTEISRDIGNGTILVKDGYLYVFASDMRKDLTTGLSVSRVALDELFSKAKENKVAEFKKYKDGSWNEPGLGGDFDSVFPQDMQPNFHYIQFNNILNKYIMIMCQAPYYPQNDGDMMMFISDNMLDWTNAQKIYIACGKRGEQYPTMVSLLPDSQTSSGDTFYIYYCSWDAYGEDGVYSWQELWSTANYVRRKVTVKK